MREKNRMSAAEVRQHQLSSMKWWQWEEKFDGLLREYGWDWIRDRVVPAQPIRKLLYAHRVPKQVVEQIVGMVQRMDRMPGIPDRIIAKEFGPHDQYSPELLELIGLTPEVAKPLPLPFTHLGAIELKTGSGKTTPEQEHWLELFTNTPGCFSLVARPEDLPYHRRVLGG